MFIGPRLRTAREAGDMTPKESQQIEKSGLFKEKFQKDLIFILSMSMVALCAFSQAQLRGNYNYFVVADWIDLAIDVLLTCSIALFVLGIAPAMFRRNRRSKKKGYPAEETLPLSKYFGMALTVSFLAAAIGILNPTDEFTAVPSGTQVNFSISPLNTKKKCAPKGEDTLCVVATSLGEKKASFVSTWEYFSPPPMFDVRVKSVSHTINIDCNAPEPATVTNLIVIDTEGNYVTLDATMKQQMMSGIQENEALKIAYETCE